MALYFLKDEIWFPDPGMAEEDGLLAVGGDLSPERLIEAYTKGIFPWFDEESPILWWAPDPRLILVPSEFRRTKSLLQTIKKDVFEVRFDKDFGQVIRHCAGIKRKDGQGTWITPDMINAYETLHESGYAHSVECYKDGKLAGGLYGVSIGKAFFGESMFYLERDASKVALAGLVDRLTDWGFHFIDAQQQTSHLKSLGSREVSRNEFLRMLEQAVKYPTISGKW